MQTDFDDFCTKFNSSLYHKELSSYLVYRDEAIDWFKSHRYEDLAAQARLTLQTRSYPHEVISWVKETLNYMYDSTIEKVDASIKHIPTFLSRE